jgi:flagellum-specific ATP synthase
LATYKKSEDLINIGAYVAGSNSRIDRAIRMINRINMYLTQEVTARVTIEESAHQLKDIIMQAVSTADHTTTAE